MGRSLGLAAYRAWARRSSDRSFVPGGARPPRTLLWIHAGAPETLLALLDLAQRLHLARPDLQVLFTLADEKAFEQVCRETAGQTAIRFERAPSEHPDAVAAFWSHWHPDMGIWAWGDLRPNLMAQAHQESCPMALIDADEAGFANRLDRWLPDATRRLLDPCVALFVHSPKAARTLEAIGISKDKISLSAPLQAGGHTLPCEDRDLTDLSQSLRGRPVWLACQVDRSEIVAVLRAHRHAMRLSHRLLLILFVADVETEEVLHDQVAKAGFRLAHWTAGEDPDDATQVLLSTDTADLGLFYRIAPVTFMGGSLTTGNSGRNPFEAASLGSAVLYGPNVRRFMPFYSRLAKAGAARIVKDGNTLGTAVTHLVAPDQAAAMAHAGWDVVSEGADATDRIIEMVHAVLDGEKPYART